MTAADHTNPRQFPRPELEDPRHEYREIGYVGRMSGQYKSPTVEESYQRPGEWQDAIGDQYARNKGYADARDYHEKLTADIAENGMNTPVTISPASPRGGTPGILRNGHHRYFAARSGGAEEVPVKYTDHSGKTLSRQQFENYWQNL